MPTSFHGAECAALEAESVPKQLARYLAWLYGIQGDITDRMGKAPLLRALTRESMAFMSSESEQEDVRRSFLSLNSLLPPLEPSFLAHSSPSHPLLRPHEPPSHCPTPLGPLLERHPRM